MIFPIIHAFFIADILTGVTIKTLQLVPVGLLEDGDKCIVASVFIIREDTYGVCEIVNATAR